MKYYVILIVTLFVSCKKEISCELVENGPKYPQCIQEIIDGALANPSSNGKISKYCYNGKVVFDVSLFNVPDASTTSFRGLDCDKICGGGTNLAGDYEGDCTAGFFDQIEFVEVVWEDPR